MLVIGHRGAKALSPENTLESIKEALKYGVDAVELDARVTKDNVPVLNHNSDLLGTSGLPMVIAQHSFNELLEAKPDLCKLDEALKFLKGRALLVLEIKSGEPPGPIVDVLRDHLKGGYKPSQIRIASFSQPILLEAHKDLAELTKVINERWSSVRAARRAQQLKTKHIAMSKNFLWVGIIAAMKRRGYKLYAYSIDNPSKARRWAHFGLYAVFTNHPERYK